MKYLHWLWQTESYAAHAKCAASPCRRAGAVEQTVLCTSRVVAAVQKDHCSRLSRKSRLEPSVAGPWPSLQNLRPFIRLQAQNQFLRTQQESYQPRLWCLLSQRRQWRLPLDFEPDGKKGEERSTGSIRRCALAQQKGSALVRGCTALPVLCLPIGPACPNASPEGAAGSAGGAMGAGAGSCADYVCARGF